MIIMLVKDLCKKFRLTLDLDEKLLSTEIDGEYTDMSEEKITSNNKLFIKEEYDGYKFTGDDCICFIIPNNPIRTVSYYCKEENYTYGCSFNSKGEVTSIV